jgi:hypothetical protein
MRRFLAIFFMVITLSVLANAQVPTSGNIFLGYSRFSANLAPNVTTSNNTDFNGWNGSLEGKIFPFVGIVADVAGFYGTQNVPITVPVCIGCPPVNSNFDTKIYTAMFGPRVSFSVKKFRPFAHVLLGAGHTSGSINGSNTSFADAIGGGLDYHLIPLIAWRFQADDLQTRFFSTTQNSLRFSTGIVFHF